MAKIIGIDLGTTNSEAAYMEGGTPRIIPSAEGSAYGGKMFPSVVAFTKDGILVGEPAKRQAVLNPDRTVMQIKRKMGTDHKVRIDEKGEGKIAVLDLGGGTFDVTLMEMGEGVFEVIATAGDTQLGGMDMDNAIVQWLVAEFRAEHGVDISSDKQAMQRLRDAGEK